LHNIQLKSLEKQPKAQDAVLVASKQPSQTVKTPSLSSVQPGGGFLSKLKAILKKQELAPAHPQYQLELKGPSVVQKEKAKVPPPVVPMPPSERKPLAGQLKSLSQTSNPGLRFPIFPEKKIGLQLPDMPTGRNWKGAIAQREAVPAAPIGASINSSKPKIEPVVSSQGFKQPQEVRPEPSDSVKHVQSPVLTGPVNLRSLQDIGSLLPSNISEPVWLELVNKLKQMVNKHGYFSVMENLERSPAYQAYMFTGSKLLETGGGFANLPASMEKYLDQKQFELFADLLMEMQG
jgi:hypothetical protein